MPDSWLLAAALEEKKKKKKKKKKNKHLKHSERLASDLITLALSYGVLLSIPSSFLVVMTQDNPSGKKKNKKQLSHF